MNAVQKNQCQKEKLTVTNTFNLLMQFFRFS